jgi:hypothetical protein
VNGAQDDEEGGGGEVYEVEKVVAGSADARQSKHGKKQGGGDSKKTNQHHNASVVGYYCARVGVESRHARPIVHTHGFLSGAPLGAGESSFKLWSRQPAAGSRGVGGFEPPVVPVVPCSAAAHESRRFTASETCVDSHVFESVSDPVNDDLDDTPPASGTMERDSFSKARCS